MDIYILFRAPLQYQDRPHLFTKLAIYKLTFHGRYVWELWDTLGWGRQPWFCTITLNKFRHGQRIKYDKGGPTYLEFRGLKPKKSKSNQLA